MIFDSSIKFFKNLLFQNFKTSRLYKSKDLYKYYENKSDLERLIGFKIKNDYIFIKALTHSSFVELSSANLKSNERLEYLGDSVLGLIVSEYLFKIFPDKDEGFLTKIRTHLVNRNALALAAENIGLVNFLFLSESLKDTPSALKTIISNAMEALIGAIYMDGGLNKTKSFIEKYIVTPNVTDGSFLIDDNYKSQLLEYTQSLKLPNPHYRLIKEEGPEHNKKFTVEAVIGEKAYGEGHGKNKKKAEQESAREALAAIKKENTGTE
jgi:ribonuclease-3